MSPADTRDPFSLGTEPGEYVPRPALEDALASLEANVSAGPPAILVVGPPGIGKTLLLRVLAERLRRRLFCLYVPYTALPPSGFCVWMLGLLETDPGGDPERALLRLAETLRRQGSGLVLLLDDAGRMRRDTLAKACELVRRSAGALVVVAAVRDEAEAPEVLAALGGPGAARIGLDAPLTLEETGAYVRARLRRVGAAPEVEARFDPDTLARLHEESGGVPRLLHQRAAAHLLTGRRPAPGVVVRGGALGALGRRLRELLLGPGGPSAPAPGRLEVFALAALFGLAAVAIPSLRGEIPLPPRPPDAQALATAQPTVEPASPEPAAAPARQSQAPISVHVNATPWAEINVDGVDVGVTPLAALPLLPGPHAFRARMPDGRVLERVVEIGPATRHVAFP